MTEWEPATEAEAAMRDALRANDQELYFRILARSDLLLPVAEQAVGTIQPGWGTWTTGGRTHVLAFTSAAALRACLGESAGPTRLSPYPDLAGNWPNHEWWLAVNPGLPIEGYLPAWFVSQLSRGDVRLPGRTMGARARLERAEIVARARATAMAPERETAPPAAPAPQHLPPPGLPPQSPPSLPPQSPPVAPPGAPAMSTAPGWAARPAAVAEPAPDPAAGPPPSAAHPFGAPAPAEPAADEQTTGWLTAARRRPAPEQGGWAATTPTGAGSTPANPAATRGPAPGGGSLFDRWPTTGVRQAAAATRNVEEATGATPAEAPTTQLSAAAGASAEDPTQAFRAGTGVAVGGADELTRAFSTASPAAADESTQRFAPAAVPAADDVTQRITPAAASGAEDVTQRFVPGADDATQRFAPGAAVPGAEDVTQRFAPGAEDATQRFAPAAVPGAEDVTQRFTPGTEDATQRFVSRVVPGAGADEPTQAYRSGAEVIESPTERLVTEAVLHAPDPDPVDPLAGSTAGPSESGRPSSPVVIEGTIVESHPLDEPAGGFASAQPAPAAAESAAGGATPNEFQPANDVEEELLAAAGVGSTDTFLSTLLLAKVLLPVAPESAPGSRPGDSGFVWQTEELEDERYVVVYTSPERLADRVDDPVETVRVKFVQLIRRWPEPGWFFAVNPGTPVGAKLPGEQIIGLANWAAEVGLGDDVEGEPVEAAPVEEAGPRSTYAPAVVDPDRPTVMQKAVAPSQLSYYLDRGYDRVSGFVHRANEVSHLTTPAALYAALGLNYPGSPFARDAEEIYVLRWPAYRPSLYRIPYGGQNEAAMRAMEGWVIERGPFRGNGFAPGESSDVVAEFKVDSARLPHGAQLWRIGADGTERVVATLDTDALLWRRVEQP